MEKQLIDELSREIAEYKVIVTGLSGNNGLRGNVSELQTRMSLVESNMESIVGWQKKLFGAMVALIIAVVGGVATLASTV